MSHEPENLYLVGDFIDGWSLQKGWHWQPECNLIVSRLMDLARRGTCIRLAIGNHDNFLREPMLQQFILQSGIVEVAEEFHHRTANGRRFLIMHGDQFDQMVSLTAMQATGWRIAQLWWKSVMENCSLFGCDAGVTGLIGRSSVTFSSVV